MPETISIAQLLREKFEDRIPPKAIKSDTNWYVWIEGIKDDKLITEIKYFAATHNVKFENYKGILKVGKLPHEHNPFNPKTKS